MSCYEWENGAIKIPTKVFAKFRREFIDGYNTIQQRKLDSLKALYTRAILGGKGKRGYNYEGFMLALTNSWDEEQLVSGLFADNKSSGKPKMPTKKMFNFVNGKDFAFDLGDAGIGFNRKAHSVSWTVYENNHACESAHEIPEAKLLFRLLRNVNFTRGSGGVIVGNDEYNTDDVSVGGGGNYVKMTFGNRK